MLLRREPAHEADDRLAIRRPHAPQVFVACRRREARDVDAARPLVYPRNAVSRQVFHRGGRWGQREVSAAVQMSCPRPRGAGGEAYAVAFRETSYVRLEYGDRR